MNHMMIQRLMLKVTKFHFPDLKRFNTVVKNIWGGGIMSNRVKVPVIQPCEMTDNLFLNPMCINRMFIDMEQKFL